MGECDHRFVYAGFRYSDGANPRPGSGAVNTYYGQAYFCERCLETQVHRSAAGDRNSYQQRLEGATPASEQEREKLVPEHDRTWGRRW